jgi:hypothetical protein
MVVRASADLEHHGPQLLGVVLRVTEVGALNARRDGQPIKQDAQGRDEQAQARDHGVDTVPDVGVASGVRSHRVGDGLRHLVGEQDDDHDGVDEDGEDEEHEQPLDELPPGVPLLRAPLYTAEGRRQSGD